MCHIFKCKPSQRLFIHNSRDPTHRIVHATNGQMAQAVCLLPLGIFHFVTKYINYHLHK